MMHNKKMEQRVLGAVSALGLSGRCGRGAWEMAADRRLLCLCRCSALGLAWGSVSPSLRFFAPFSSPPPSFHISFPFEKV